MNGGILNSIYVVKARPVNPNNPSVFQKLKAVAGLNNMMGFCPQNRFYYTDNFNPCVLDEMYSCPVEEKRNHFREVYVV